MTDLQKANGENYKGIMLCTRPGENQNKVTANSPFISRVDPKDRLGVNPTNIKQHRVYLHVDDKLIKHKKWLQEFSLRTKLKKERNYQSSDFDKEHIKKLKEKAALDRARSKQLKEEYHQIANLIKQTSQQQEQTKFPLTAENLKNLQENFMNNNVTQPQQTEPVQEEQPKQIEKPVEKPVEKKQNPQQNNQDLKKKPKWAMTQNQVENQEDQEVDNLLNFVENLDFDNYVQDVELNAMLTSLKTRIDEIKEEKELVEQLKKEQDQQSQQSVPVRPTQGEDFADNQSRVSQQSQTKSIRSVQTIREEVKERVEKEDKPGWEDNISQKSRQQRVDDKIVKQVADEILHQYKNLSGVHSNQSIRRILESQAYKHLENGYKINGPRIEVSKTVDIDKNKCDPSYLPYLHRNPAV